MRKQSTSMNADERRQLFAEAQRVLAEHAPVLYFAAPKVIVATSARVRGVTASVLAPNLLWNAERLFVSRRGKRQAVTHTLPRVRAAAPRSAPSPSSSSCPRRRWC